MCPGTGQSNGLVHLIAGIHAALASCVVLQVGLWLLQCVVMFMVLVRVSELIKHDHMLYIVFVYIVYNVAIRHLRQSYCREHAQLLRSRLHRLG